jgi:hypothetical protein
VTQVLSPPLSTGQRDRWAAAQRIKNFPQVNLPVLTDWNYEPCEHHAEPRPDCEYQLCGGPLFDHQTTGVTWLYAVRKGILASEPGVGKTNQILATLCLAKQRGERIRALLVVPTTSLGQWQAEARRFAPGLATVAVHAGLKPEARRAVYGDLSWQVLIIGWNLMTRDISDLLRIQASQLISDDVDPLLNSDNVTHQCLVQLAQRAGRVIISNATSLQTRLEQLWATAVPLGGRTIWPRLDLFQERYVQKRRVTVQVGWETHVATHKRVPVYRSALKVVGYQNLREFKAFYAPMQIRHRYEDLTDLRIPDVVSEQVYLDLFPAQRAKYAELQTGVLELQLADEPPYRKQVSAMTAWLHGAQVCAGLAALGEPDGPGTSSKLDWTVNAIERWDDRKIVVYCRNRGTIAALQRRLDGLDIGHATIWGLDANKDHRAEAQQRFWQDPACQVMILSAAGERSLNLQNAQVLILVDLQLNPARVHQTMGRIRRTGSPHDRVFCFTLLAVDTQEDRYQATLGVRQALFDAVHDEDHGDLFARIDPDDLLRLIRP